MGKFDMGTIIRWRAERLGIPIDSWRPERYWIISLDQESRPAILSELLLLRSYRDYLITHYYTEGYVARLLRQSLPAAAGHNTTIFKKLRPGRWVYRKISWIQGPPFVPWSEERARPSGIPLLQLLELIQQPSVPAWESWKTEHPDRFPRPVAA